MGVWRRRRKLVVFYYSQYSMKYQKSSYSLHSTSTSVFKEQSQNILRQRPLKLLFKRQVSYSKETSSIYNARGRLNHCSQLHAQLQALSQQVELANKDLGLELTFLREEVVEHTLKDAEAQLSKDVKELKKQITIRKRSDMLRYESIVQILNSMWKSHKEVKKKVEEIEDRVARLEHVMGGPTPTIT